MEQQNTNEQDSHGATEEQEMVKRKTWEDFRKTGLLTHLNSFLHIFGWAIVYEIDDEQSVIGVYPARVKFRGFGPEAIDAAHKKTAQYLKENIDELVEETKL